MKQNFGIYGSSADFTIGKGKVGPKYKISFVFIAKKSSNFKIFWTLKIGLVHYKLRAPSVEFILSLSRQS